MNDPTLLPALEHQRPLRVEDYERMVTRALFAGYAIPSS
jgi:hypothetical protein